MRWPVVACLAIAPMLWGVAETPPVIAIVPSEPLGFLEPLHASSQIWIRPGRQAPAGGISILVRYAENVSASQPTTFECEIRCVENASNSIVGMKLLDTTGAVVALGEATLDLAAGVNRCDFPWQPAALPDGQYRAKFYVAHPLRRDPAYRDLKIIKISEDTLARELDLAREALTTLKEHMNPFLVPGISVLGARFHLADRYLGVAEEFAVQGDWPAAFDVARYVQRSTTSIRAYLALAPDAEELLTPIPQPDMSAVTIRDGSFYAGDTPVYLFGWNQELNDSVELTTPHEFALNASVVAVDPANVLASADSLRQRFDTLFAAAREHNVAVTVMAPVAEAAPWTPDTMPETMNALEPVTFIPAHQPQARAAMESFVRTLMPALQDRPSLLSVSLADNPGFRMDGPEVLAAFSEYVRALYPDRLAVNRAWQTRFADFSEIRVWWTNDRPSYQYDWQRFQQRSSTRFFEGLTELVRQFLPSTPLQIQYAANVFSEGMTRLGIDHEALTELTQISGCAVATGIQHSDYALDYPRSAIMYAFLRSLAPDQPIYNTQQRLWNDADPFAEYSFEYSHSAMWDGAIEGQDGSALAYSLTGGITELSREFYEHPDSFEGYVTASININRLAPVVAAFQAAPDEVSILFSIPSLVLNDGVPYVTSLFNAFEGVSQAGRKVGFITEDQIRAGKLDDVDILVIPNMTAISESAFDAVNAYIENHGIVIRAGTTLPYDAWGHSRTSIVSRSLETVYLQESAQATQFYHAMDAVNSRPGVAQTPHIINNFYYPFEGIKSRFLIRDDVAYLYLLSLRPQAETVYLTGGYSKGRDLINARDVAFPLMLEPLQPMLIQLEPLPAGATQPPIVAAPTGVPVIPVAPVVPEPPDVETKQAKVRESRRGIRY